jgi:hypothetical protein
LDDAEIDALFKAVATEAERRGRLSPKPTRALAATPQRAQKPTEKGNNSLTTGKLNAVRAAFKVGLKPSAIAREFGVSPADVRKALATDWRPKSGN